MIVLMGLTAIPLEGGSCESLSELKLANTTITSAVNVAAGTFTLPSGSPSEPGRSPAFDRLPSFCRVQGIIQPSGDSQIGFEVWLPVSGWNGKYQGIGNGGFAGYINYAGLADAVAGKYATASTNTGHQSANARGGADWARGHPERIIDFGYRAIHETAVAAKAVIGAFYGQNPSHSYFSSCSTGGRQALMEAQRFPADYDGIIAGAAPIYYTDLISAAATYFAHAASNGGSSYFGASKLPFIQKAVLDACDTLDGVKDGLLENPTRCHFDLSKLLCAGAETDRCLTKSQLGTLKKIYDGVRDVRGNHIFPGYSPGGESEERGWGVWITGKKSIAESAGYFFVTEFFRNMVYSDPSWNVRTFDWERDKKAADDKLARILNATDPDLAEFKKRGGKLILYHGWNDASIPALNSVDYYESMLSKVEKKETDEFVRLFMVPGMQHCGGGTGPNSFGQLSVARGDPEYDMGAALERWVEKGVAPNRIIATKFKSNDIPASGIVRTRPLCPYPQVAKYKGSGSTDEAANFVCTESK